MPCRLIGRTSSSFTKIQSLCCQLLLVYHSHPKTAHCHHSRKTQMSRASSALPFPAILPVLQTTRLNLILKCGQSNSISGWSVDWLLHKLAHHPHRGKINWPDTSDVAKGDRIGFQIALSTETRTSTFRTDQHPLFGTEYRIALCSTIICLPHCAQILHSTKLLPDSYAPNSTNHANQQWVKRMSLYLKRIFHSGNLSRQRAQLGRKTYTPLECSSLDRQ